jgi:hypothetical protein
MMEIEKNAVSLQRISNTAKMDKRLKRQAALYMLITLVDENEGYIEINSDVIRSTFNDEDQVVKAKLKDGSVALAADLDGDVLHEAVSKWMGDNPTQSKYIMSKLDPRRLHGLQL